MMARQRRACNKDEGWGSATEICLRWRLLAVDCVGDDCCMTAILLERDLSLVSQPCIVIGVYLLTLEAILTSRQLEKQALYRV